jgi:hypothetical protein
MDDVRSGDVHDPTPHISVFFEYLNSLLSGILDTTGLPSGYYPGIASDILLAEPAEMNAKISIKDSPATSRVYKRSNNPVVLQDAARAPGRRTFWTDVDTDILRNAIRQYGRNWALIESKFPELGRNQGQLKDRARTVRNILSSNGEDLGVWE